MRIQESLVTDKQIALELFSENGKYRLPIQGKDYYFPTLEKVHEAFLSQSTYDTIKLTHNGKKSYLHLFMDEIEVFDTKKALRQQLSQDSQGMWAEIRNGQTHFYIQERGWLSISYKEMTEKECVEKLQHTSTMTKALGIGLGMLALLPGAVELARRVSLGTKEAAMGLIALNQKSPVLGAVGYSLIPKQVEAQAMGTEFQVNTYTTSDQQYPSVAPLNDGGFIVTWQSLGQDGDLGGVYGQRYDSSGMPIGSEFQINTYTSSDQDRPSVAPLNDGGFVVVWQSDGQDGEFYGIYGQRYSTTGIATGAEFKINTYTTKNQGYPRITPVSNGGFAVAWVSEGQDGNFDGIFGQTYDLAGMATGTEFQVNTHKTNDQQFPSIAPLNNGGFVVVWQSYRQDGDGYGLYGQRYDANGTAAGTEFQINTYTTSQQTSPRVAPLNDGSSVVVWQSFSQDGGSYGIYGQRYDANGVVVGNEFQINTYTTSSQQNPSIAPLTDGGFVVVWQSFGQGGSLYDSIFGQRYDSNGATVGTEFQVNTYTYIQTNPSIAALDDGGFVVIWDSLDQDGDRTGIFGQRYDASGNPTPLQLPISTIVTPTPGATTDSPSQNTPTPFFTPTRSALTGSTPLPSNIPSTTAGMLGSITVSSGGPTSNSLATVSTQSSLTSSATGHSSTPSPTMSMSGTTSTSSMVSSAAPGSRTQAAVSTSSSRVVTSISSATMSISSTSVIASVENIVYGENYPILGNDQVVGSYSVSGGTGLLDSGNSNVIYFDFDPSFQPEEGEVITLFYIPEEEVALWESVEIEGENFECLEAQGQVATNQGRSSYQLVFEDTECLAIAPRMLATALPLTLN